MATQRIFLSKEFEDIRQVGNSMSTKYNFVDGKLNIYWKNKPVYSKEAKKNEAYIVKCDGGKPQVDTLKLPKRRENAIMWLCGFTKPYQALTLDEYNHVFDSNEQCYSWDEYYPREEQDTAHETPHWSVAICNRSDCGGIHKLGIYLISGASDNDIKELLFAWSELRFFSLPREWFFCKLEELNVKLTDYEKGKLLFLQSK